MKRVLKRVAIAAGLKACTTIRLPDAVPAFRPAVIVFLIALAAAGPAAAAQRGRGRASAPEAEVAEAPGVSPAEIQRMFDSYALIQAQEQLKISDEQFPQFLTRFKTLQDTRRKNMTERFRMVQDLRRLIKEAQPDETRLRERLKALDDLDARAQSELAKAYEAINQVLDVHQQAKFRVFEENMENRKLALVMRARQASRPKQ
jgi:Spy/CpxP family protein refolding chaperone